MAAHGALAGPDAKPVLDACLTLSDPPFEANRGGGANGEMANLTNEKGKFAIAIFRHFSPLVVFEIKHFRHQGN